MKRLLTGLAAASIVVGTTIPMAMAATTSVSQWFKMTIQVNGTTLSNPYGIAESDGSTTTTYIPMYYVNQALVKVGYQVKWDGTAHAWQLTTPQAGLKIPAMTVGSGNTEITVNGGLIKKVNTIVQPDPVGGVSTTYVPIYYLTPILQALGVTDKWDGTTHQWSMVANSGTTTGGTTSSSIATPTIRANQSNGATNISVSGAVNGGTLALFNATGSEVISTSADADGTATFYNVVTGSYYVIETVNGENSNKSNVVTVSTNTTTVSTPSIFASESNGGWYIGVNNAAAGATVTLYSTTGTKVATTTANQYGYATFNNVGSATYYVVASLNGQSYQSNAVSVSTVAMTPLSAPNASVTQNNGAATITATNVSPGASVTLYTSGGVADATTVANASGNATFSNVSAGTYYVEQNSNGQTSTASNSVTVAATLTAPSLTASESNNVETLTVNQAKAGAIVTVYTSAGTVYAAATTNSSGAALFSNVPTGTYYVVQDWNGETSEKSNFVTVGVVSTALSLTASNSNGVETLAVANAYAGATVTLYTTAGAVSAITTANTAGAATFSNVATGTYYVVQTVNGQTSTASNFVTISTALTTPDAFVSSNNGVKTITVTNLKAGATVVLYASNGTVYSTTTANSSAYATFTNVASGTYYLVQNLNGATSAASNDFVV